MGATGPLRGPEGHRRPRQRREGRQDPAEWKPPLQSSLPDYARSWAALKVAYGLTADQAEIDALRTMLTPPPPRRYPTAHGPGPGHDAAHGRGHGPAFDGGAGHHPCTDHGTPNDRRLLRQLRRSTGCRGGTDRARVRRDRLRHLIPSALRRRSTD